MTEEDLFKMREDALARTDELAQLLATEIRAAVAADYEIHRPGARRRGLPGDPPRTKDRIREALRVIQQAQEPPNWVTWV